MPVILGYWNCRGIANPSRYVLNYVGEDFQENSLELTEDRGHWTSIKNHLDLDFPNLPYLIDGDLKITQSLAIIRYLGRKHGLAGKTDHETAILDMLEQQVYDLQSGLEQLSYNPLFKDVIESYISSLPDKLRLFDKFLEGKNFLLGDRLTYVDFTLFETLEQHLLLKESALHNFANLKDFVKRIGYLPSMQKYQQSEEYLKWPIFSPQAQFGGKGTYPMFN